MPLINISYGNYAEKDKITAILKPGPAPLRRLVRDAREDHKLIDATQGKKTRSVLVMDSGHIILSSASPETLFARYGGKNDELLTAENEDEKEEQNAP